jgi:FkbM family methyltransferase
MSGRLSLLRRVGLRLRALGARLAGNSASAERHRNRLLRDSLADVIAALVAWLEARGGLRGKAVVDVGANLGAPAIPLARATGCRVLAVEPVPDTFARLRRNVEQNGLSGAVIPLNAAISVERGGLEMAVHEDLSRSEVYRGGGAQGSAGDFRRVLVPSLPLEAAVAAQGLSPGELALVWSDTQGYERQVVESGRPLWAAGVPLFVELWPRGLAAHGGVDAFAAAVRGSFARFILRDEPRAGRAAAASRPVDELPGVLSGLQGHTDALLLPPEGGDVSRS